MNGILIAIEGADGAGKTTQTKLLAEALVTKGREVATFKFPQPDSFYGNLVKKFLTGELGTIDVVSPYLIAIPFALDRQSVAAKIKETVAQGGVVISDRYTLSNIVHHAAKFEDPAQQQEFIKWADELEYSQLQIPAENIVIYLDMPNEMSSKNIDERAQGRDIHEESESYQKRVVELFRKMASENSHWIRINCVNEHNELLGPSEVHDKIMSELQKLGVMS